MARYNYDSGEIEQIVFLEYKGKYYINPTDEQIDIAQMGYKLVTTPCPDYDPQTHIAIQTYTIEGDSIIEGWEIREVEV